MATGAETQVTIEEIEPFEAAEEIDGGDVVLIDTREPHEYQEAHLEGGKLVPPGLLGDEIEAAAPDKSARTILYCRSGNRSAIAAAQMQALGYDNVASMAGGILAWQEQGLPVVAAERHDRRAARALLAPHAAARGRGRRPAQAAEREGAAARRRRARRADGALPGRGRDRHDRPGRRRRRRRLQPAAPGDPQHRADRDAEDRVGAALHRSAQPRRQGGRAPARLDADNILEIIEDYDIVVDGADNFPTRYLLNDASVRLRKPVVSASILSFDGQISTFVPFEGPCYRCLYPTPPPAELAPSCSANGVLGVMAGTMGTLQANEVIKLVLGVGEPLIGRLLLYEALGTRFTELKVRRDPDCPICGENAPEIPRVGDGPVPRLRALLRRIAGRFPAA